MSTKAAGEYKKYFNFNMNNLLKTLSRTTKTSNSLFKRFKSSHEWLQRQMSDPYVEKAKVSVLHTLNIICLYMLTFNFFQIMNYRCRSSFKLLEINEKHKLLQPGNIVIDIGAAPGSFSQVCVKAVNSDGSKLNKPKGTVIGIDRLQIYPLDGAKFLGGSDFRSKETQDKLKILLNGKNANVVLSDMAPNSSGIKSMDFENIMELAKSVFNFAKSVTAKDGSLLIKVWENPEVKKLQNQILEYYESCKIVKPTASRSDSAEKFILAKGFKKLLEH